MYHCLSEQCELKCGASQLDKPKIQISEDGNLNCQNDYLTFKLDKIGHIMWHMFKKKKRENNYLIPFLV